MRFFLIIWIFLFLAACKEKPEYSVIGAQGSMRAVSIPEEEVSNESYYREVVRFECPKNGICIISFFSGVSSVTWPLSDAAVAAQTAQYNRNPNSGMDRLLFSCRLEIGRISDCF
jgi:hypothetical protein